MQEVIKIVAYKDLKILTSTEELQVKQRTTSPKLDLFPSSGNRGRFAVYLGPFDRVNLDTVSEMLCLEKFMTMDNVQNNYHVH